MTNIQMTVNSLLPAANWRPRPELNWDQRFRKRKQTIAKQGKNCEFDTGI
jgi:hypothetical protein